MFAACNHRLVNRLSSRIDEFLASKGIGVSLAIMTWLELQERRTYGPYSH